MRNPLDQQYRFTLKNLRTGQVIPRSMTGDEILNLTAQARLPHGTPSIMLRNLIKKWNRQQPGTWRYTVPRKRRR